MIIRKKSSPVTAFRLGEDSALEREMIARGVVRLRADGTYEVFSRESGPNAGQIARRGDFVKLDGTGAVYPNRAEAFLAGHRRRGGEWIQQSRDLTAWEKGRSVCPELRFLLDTGRLQLDPDSPERYFRARLWDAELTAAQDAVLVFYRVEESGGEIRDVDFNFVARDEFLRSYEIIEE